MRRMGLASMVILVLLASGCAGAGVASYRPIDFDRDLDAVTLGRYRSEAEAARQAGRTGHMVTLEHTNWWLLGLLAYWRQGSVRLMHGADGQPQYMVSQSNGYGPLSLAYVTGQGATFDADGKRVSAMGMDSILWGHLAMFHDMGNRDPAGAWSRHKSMHLIHHLVNVSTMHGETSWSLFSAPNPVGAGR